MVVGVVVVVVVAHRETVWGGLVEDGRQGVGPKGEHAESPREL